MKIILPLLCILGGVIIFLPQTPVPAVYHRPLLFLFIFVCSLISAVRSYRRGAASGSTYIKVTAVLTPLVVVAFIVLFVLQYR